MIEVNNVTKKYGKNDTFVINGISFLIEKNMICGLCGHNGAGKTTVLKMMATLYRPNSGNVVINGFDTVKNRVSVRKIIGVVFEAPTLYEQLTGEENIMYFASLFGVNKCTAKDRAKKMYQELDVDFQDNRVSSYSKGMMQKISIIRALITDPEIVILDEPTSGLDILSKYTLREYIWGLKKLGKTVVIASHVTEDIDRLCDKVVIMDKGKILENSPVHRLKEKYQTENFEKAYIQLQKMEVVK